MWKEEHLAVIPVLTPLAQGRALGNALWLAPVPTLLLITLAENSRPIGLDFRQVAVVC